MTILVCFNQGDRIYCKQMNIKHFITLDLSRKRIYYDISNTTFPLV